MNREDINIRLLAEDIASEVIDKVRKTIEDSNEKIQEGMKKTSDATSDLTNELKRLSTEAIRAFTDELQRIDETAKAARSIGIMTEDLIGLRLAAAEYSGIESPQLDKALREMVKRTAEAGAGVGEAAQFIDGLGLSTSQLLKLDPAAMFRVYAEAIKGVETESERLMITQRIFGEEASQLVLTLDAGTQGIDAMQKRAEELGITFSDLEARHIEKVNDSLTELGAAFRGLGTDIAVGLAPDLNNAIEQMKWIADFKLPGVGDDDPNDPGFWRKVQLGWQAVTADATAFVVGGELAPVIGTGADGRGTGNGAMNVAMESLGIQQEKRDQAMKEQLRDIQDVAEDKEKERLAVIAEMMEAPDWDPIGELFGPGAEAVNQAAWGERLSTWVGVNVDAVNQAVESASRAIVNVPDFLRSFQDPFAIPKASGGNGGAGVMGWILSAFGSRGGDVDRLQELQLEGGRLLSRGRGAVDPVVAKIEAQTRAQKKAARQAERNADRMIDWLNKNLKGSGIKFSKVK